MMDRPIVKDIQGTPCIQLAAQDMYEALKACLEWCETIEDEDSRLPLDVKMQALQALSKAQGKEVL